MKSNTRSNFVFNKNVKHNCKMAIKDSATEQQIKDAARQLFFKQGRFKATTQEIADAAGVNRTLVNYYFRSRNVLFDQVLKDARDSMTNRLKGAAEDCEMPLRKKVEHLVDVMMDHAVNYPYMDIYMITRMNEDVNHQNDVLADMKKTEELKQFLKEIDAEMEKGTIEKMPAFHFFLNILSLITYPVVAQPLFKKAFHYSDRQYQQLMKDRKEIIMKTLFK